MCPRTCAGAKTAQAMTKSKRMMACKGSDSLRAHGRREPERKGGEVLEFRRWTPGPTTRLCLVY